MQIHESRVTKWKGTPMPNHSVETINPRDCNVKMWQHSILMEQRDIRALFFHNKSTMRNSSNVSRYTKPVSMSGGKKEKKKGGEGEGPLFLFGYSTKDAELGTVPCTLDHQCLQTVPLPHSLTCPDSWKVASS